MSDGTEIPPSLRMIASILAHVEAFFEESGCPLSLDQVDVLLAARDAAIQSAEAVAS
jgi:hypothetical protein